VAQHSNRDALVDGTLRCLARLPAERVTARAIAEEAEANLASITYHFGSKDELVTEAIVVGLDRWLASIADELDGVVGRSPAERLRRAAAMIDASRERNHALESNFVGALARAQHDPRVRKRLAAGFRDARADVAAVLGLESSEPALDTAGLVLALFHGLLIQALLDPELAIEGDRMTRAQARLRRLLPAR
jgi:AcrR family transcriptional regulator